jgi:hypothetical protein
MTNHPQLHDHDIDLAMDLRRRQVSDEQIRTFEEYVALSFCTKGSEPDDVTPPASQGCYNQWCGPI